MVSNILVTGFPHCGTSKLREIIGSHPDVQDHPHETVIPPSVTIEKGKKWLINKTPRYFDGVLHFGHYDKIIFVMRNPYYVFSSLHRRFGDQKLDRYTNVRAYMLTLEIFNKLRTNNQNPYKLYTVKYEELMDEGKMKEIFNWIGLEPIDYHYKNHQAISLADEPFSGKEGDMHRALRNWQLSQPLMNMNTPDKITLPDEWKELINDHKDLMELVGYELL